MESSLYFTSFVLQAHRKLNHLDQTPLDDVILIVPPNFILGVLVFCMHACMSAPCICSGWGDQKSEVDPL